MDQSETDSQLMLVRSSTQLLIYQGSNDKHHFSFHFQEPPNLVQTPNPA